MARKAKISHRRSAAVTASSAPTYKKDRRLGNPGRAHAIAMAVALADLKPEASTRSQLRVMRGVVGLKDREVADVAGKSLATIRRWRREGESERTDTYDDLRVVVERLLAEQTIQPKLIAGWLRSRNAGLGYDRPLDALREGDFARVMHVVECFIAGAVPIEAPSSVLANLDDESFVAPGSTSDPQSLLDQSLVEAEATGSLSRSA
jgi:hypothetical protein